MNACRRLILILEIGVNPRHGAARASAQTWRCQSPHVRNAVGESRVLMAHWEAFASSWASEYSFYCLTSERAPRRAGPTKQSTALCSTPSTASPSQKHNPTSYQYPHFHMY